MAYFNKSCYVIALAAMAFACAKESDSLTVPAGEKVFTAGITTKTELVSGNAVHWVAGDNISLFDGVANREFTTTDAGATAKFTGSASDAATYYALYPYQAGASCEGGVITATLPATQTAVAGSFANLLNLSVAKTTDTHLHFKNVCALVAVDLQKYFEVTSIKLEGRNNEDLAGTLSISFDGEGTPVVNSITGASKSITLSNGGAVLAEGVYAPRLTVPSLMSTNTVSVSTNIISETIAMEKCLCATILESPIFLLRMIAMSRNENILISVYRMEYSAITSSFAESEQGDGSCVHPLFYLSNRL